MKNFPFEHDGQTLWYSRSVACSMYLFVHVCHPANLDNKNGWYILTSRRGAGSPNNIGKWNVPGGYLDFDETLEDAARRECYEETGVYVNGPVEFASVSTNIYSKSQNVVCSFYKAIKVIDIKQIESQFSFDKNEENEVTDIELTPVQWFFDAPIKAAHDYAFGHDRMIREIFTKKIDVPFWKRWIVGLVERWTRININIQ